MPFKPGKSGNPNGRPKIVLPDGRTLRDVCREHTETAVNALIEIVKNDEAPPAARVGAATSILDRGWGKPTQPISGDDDAAPLTIRDANMDLANAPAQIIDWLAEQYATRLRPN